MGNCFALCRPNRRSSIGAATDEHQKVLRVVKMDGKILEFGAPILVEDLLVDFSGSSVGVSKKTSQRLPPNYELQTGEVYYLLPSPASSGTGVRPAEGVSSMADKEQAGGVKRIKVVITKQQLQDLLLKQISVDEMLAGLENRACCSADSSTGWKPKLESIPEGIE